MQPVRALLAAVLLIFAASCKRATEESTKSLPTGVSPAERELLQPALRPLTDPEAQRRTTHVLRNLGTALGAWLGEQGGGWDASTYEIVSLYSLQRIPRSEVLDRASRFWPTITTADGWGHEVEVHLYVPDAILQPARILVRSPGRDGQFDGDNYVARPFSPDDFDHDTVWLNGKFLAWPDGLDLPDWEFHRTLEVAIHPTRHSGKSGGLPPATAQPRRLARAASAASGSSASPVMQMPRSRSRPSATS
jgi:hypothetical protein